MIVFPQYLGEKEVRVTNTILPDVMRYISNNTRTIPEDWINHSVELSKLKKVGNTHPTFTQQTHQQKSPKSPSKL